MSEYEKVLETANDNLSISLAQLSEQHDDLKKKFSDILDASIKFKWTYRWLLLESAKNYLISMGDVLEPMPLFGKKIPYMSVLMDDSIIADLEFKRCFLDPDAVVECHHSYPPKISKHDINHKLLDVYNNYILSQLKIKEQNIDYWLEELRSLILKWDTIVNDLNDYYYKIWYDSPEIFMEY
jgi:hypothetical protein